MKDLILFFDTETTGLPDWKSPSDAEHQPHLVQLAAILADADTREEISSFDLIVSPDGWVIPEEVTAIHGIDIYYALRVGLPEPLVLDAFMSLWRNIETVRVAHNKTFDQRIIRIAAKRYSREYIQDQWADKDSHACTMRMYQKLFGGKNVKLIDAYMQATGKVLENAHSALADTRACMAVYWWLLDQQAEQAA